jgi:DNA repair exonuclease SbcCD ATPase subunit
MKILRLEVNNIGGVQAFELDANGEHVVIGGKNGAGKSTILRAIAGALGGKGERGAEPLRRGAKDGKVLVDLGDLVVKWRVNEAGKHALSVETKEGAVMKSPQAKLKKLFGERTFDPLGFYSMTQQSQARTIADLFGVDFDDFDKRRDEVFKDRTAVNRMAKEYKAQAAGVDVPSDAPDEPIDVSDVHEKLREAERGHDRMRQMKSRLKELEEQSVRLNGRLDSAKKNKENLVEQTRKNADEDIAAAQQAVRDAQERLKKVEARKSESIMDAEKRGDAAIEDASARIVDTNNRIIKGSAAINDLAQKLVNVDELTQQLRDAEETNKAFDAKRKREDLEALANAKRDESAKLTSRIQEIDDEKTQAIVDANIPVDGLSIDNGVVTWHGKQLSSLSSSEQLRVSIALGIATHPDIAVMLIDKWGDLDDDGRTIVREMADESGVQIWTTVVGTKDEDISVVIREGRIAE